MFPWAGAMEERVGTASTIPAANIADLCAVAKQLTQDGKGLLAADESPTTLGKRLALAGLENTEVLSPVTLLDYLPLPNQGG